MANVRFLDKHLVSKYLAYCELIPAVRDALLEYSSGTSQQPLRHTISVPKSNGTLFVMPCYSARRDTLMTKVLTVYPDCIKQGLPSRHSFLLLFDSATGALKCIMDGNVISAMRTASATVVATQTLVDAPPKILGVLGSGKQARAHITALTSVYQLDQIRVWSRNVQHAEQLCQDMVDLNITPCVSAEEAVSDADVVVTVTQSTDPVLKGKWLKPGCLINCIGACRPSSRELDDDCLIDSVVYTDSIESANNESGDIIDTQTQVYAEIGEILLGVKKIKRGRFTVFKSLGIALEDAAAAKLVWENAEKHDNKEDE